MQRKTMQGLAVIGSPAACSQMPGRDRPEGRPISRRSFLSGCSAGICAGCGAVRAQEGAPAHPRVAAKMRIRAVFSHPPAGVEAWPYKGYDFESTKAEWLAKLREGCPELEFLPVSVKSGEDGKKVLAADAEVEGYVVCLLGIPAEAGYVIAASGRPAVFVTHLFGGGIDTARGPRVVRVSSSDFSDAVRAVRAFETIGRLRSSILLDVVEKEPAEAGAIKELFGTTVRTVGSAEINEAYKAAGRAAADAQARDWISNAARVVEPTPAEVSKSAAMYVAMRDLMRRYGAHGVAMDCLNLFYGGKLPAYPCLGFLQLNDEGFVGACEADLNSAVTMLVVQYMTGRPGYISDPVIDTSKNQVIYAHCVAPTRVYGRTGPQNPYEIRSHSEDRKGAAVRSLMPLGETVTTLKFIPQDKRVVIHKARTVANIDDDKACRTKLAAECRDARKLLAGWNYGWHRVTVYGDHQGQVETLSTLLGIQVVEEG